MFVWNGVVRHGSDSSEWLTDNGHGEVGLTNGDLERPPKEEEECTCLGSDSSTQGVFPMKCLTFEICAFCQLEDNLQSRLTLKGLCQDARLRSFDASYHVYKYENERMAIRFAKGQI